MQKAVIKSSKLTRFDNHTLQEAKDYKTNYDIK